MKPELQIMKIAEACGYIDPYVTTSGSVIAWANRNEDGKTWGTVGVPNYLDDLNAMHDACYYEFDGFPLVNPSIYAEALLDVVIRDTNIPCIEGCFYHINATASQRAEAFLKAIGQWEETE